VHRRRDNLGLVEVEGGDRGGGGERSGKDLGVEGVPRSSSEFVSKTFSTG